MKDEREPREADEETGIQPYGTDDGEVEILGFEGVADEEEAREPGSGAAGAIGPELGAAIEAERAAAEERYLRLRADFDNYRKRHDRERSELLRYALAEPLRELLPVVDNLDRALAAQGGVDDLRRGVELIVKQLRDTLGRYGLVEVPAAGARFDPRFHEAVAREESAAVDAPTVVTELQRGYLLHDRLLRPAMVRVAVPVEQTEPEAAPAGGDEPDSGEPT
jgi:molecular chaperone GrpE